MGNNMGKKRPNKKGKEKVISRKNWFISNIQKQYCVFIQNLRALNIKDRNGRILCKLLPH